MASSTTPTNPPAAATVPAILEDDSGAAAAIREIERIVVNASPPGTIEIPVSDGKTTGFKVPVVFLPTGKGGLQAVSLLDTLEKGAAFALKQRLATATGPDARTGTAAHQSLASFIAHANRFKAENSAVWADSAKRQLVAVLDYHAAGATSPASWGRHRGTYLCPLSEAWLAWGGGAALKLDQDGLSELLDARDLELAEGDINGKPGPSPAYLITMASNLEVFSTATAKRERDANTGRVKLAYSEDKGVSGTIVPPPAFLIRIPVFADAQPEVLEVRLRVSVENAKATFEVQIHAATEVLKNAFEDICERVETQTSLPVFVGTPEAA
jgi:hypothetical protein